VETEAEGGPELAADPAETENEESDNE